MRPLGSIPGRNNVEAQRDEIIGADAQSRRFRVRQHDPADDFPARAFYPAGRV
ncbi:MAG TPA: hypothetical protein VML19_06745 [Verrucomicrobiae bacterium]|nr:hypothetical protein [Verrucomicrobiae bacterium]